MHTKTLCISHVLHILPTYLLTFGKYIHTMKVLTTELSRAPHSQTSLISASSLYDTKQLVNLCSVCYMLLHF
jgi:hypothetical protein